MAVNAWSGEGMVRNFPATATIQFEGTSTLHDFSGRLPSQPFQILLSNGTWFADADVLAGLMATANEKRDRKMHEMLGTNAFPRLHGTVAAAPVPGPSGTNVSLRLRIRDKSRDLPVRITGWTESPDAIRFHAAWDLSLQDYSLKPPSVLGVIRVGDRVQLQADITASKTGSPISTAPVSVPVPLPAPAP